MPFKSNLISLAGSLLALLCCLGFGPMVGLLTAVGVGFLVNDAILAPLLVGMLLTGGIAPAITYRRHRKPAPLLVHIASAITVLIFTFGYYLPLLVWLGMGGLIVAAALNLAGAGKPTVVPDR